MFSLFSKQLLLLSASISRFRFLFNRKRQEASYTSLWLSCLVARVLYSVVILRSGLLFTTAQSVLLMVCWWQCFFYCQIQTQIFRNRFLRLTVSSVTSSSRHTFPSVATLLLCSSQRGFVQYSWRDNVVQMKSTQFCSAIYLHDVQPWPEHQ